jgi:hypothetical protein
MTHQLSITLSDEEYAALAREAAKQGVSVDALAHDALALRLHIPPVSSHPLANHEFTERQYQEGKIPTLPTREPLKENEAAERERRAQLLAGGLSASEMVIEDRGLR